MITDIIVITALVLVAAFIVERFIARGHWTGAGWVVVLIVGLGLGFAKASYAGQWGRPYPAQVTEIKDGDTFTAVMKVFPGVTADQGVFVVRDVRLSYIDTPEKNGQCPREKRLAAEAESRLAQLIGEVDARVAVVVEAIDSFGRPVGRVQAGGRDVGKTLLAEGLARRWEQGNYRDGYWCLEFKSQDKEG